MINVHTTPCKVHVVLVRFSRVLGFLDRFTKNNRISNIMTVRTVKAERTDVHVLYHDCPYSEGRTGGCTCIVS